MADESQVKENEPTAGADEEQGDAANQAEKTEKKPRARKYLSKHMRMYPELYRSDTSIHPSYTTLKNLPYYVVCRRRIQSTKRQINRQLNKEIMRFAMMQMFAIASVRIDRLFSVGMPPKTMIVPDFATVDQRRRIHELLRDTL